jgi:hypothetical protein
VARRIRCPLGFSSESGSSAVMGNTMALDVCASSRKGPMYDLYISYHHRDERHGKNQHVAQPSESGSKLLKTRLRERNPLLTVFLDVDDLEDVANVNVHVGKSLCLVVFLSETYIRSRNCMGELRRAVQQSLPLIVMFDAGFSVALAKEALARHDDASLLTGALFASEPIRWDRTQMPLQLPDAMVETIVKRIPQKTKAGV